MTEGARLMRGSHRTYSLADRAGRDTAGPPPYPLHPPFPTSPQRDLTPPTALRSFAHGTSAHRWRPYGPLQLGLRSPARRAVPPAHRGHRSRAVATGVRALHPGGAALARPRLGRGAGRGRPPWPLSPVGAPGALSRGRGGAARARRGLPLLLFDRAPGGSAGGAHACRTEPRLRRPL